MQESNDLSPLISDVFDAALDPALRASVPHQHRAALIGRVIGLKAAAAAGFADVLNALSAGIFLVDAASTIVHANTSGHAMLASGGVLRAVGGCLVASDPESNQALREVLAAAAKGDSAVGIRGISQSLVARSDNERYVAHVVPLTSGERRHTAVAIVFVHKLAFQIPSSPEIIAKTYKLTPTELRVLLAIVQIGGVPEVAEALGIGETTVKTHLGRLFQKTGTSRQADLVKLVAGYANPLFE